MYNKSVLSRCLQFNTFKLNFIGSLSFSHFRMYIKYSHFTQLNFFVNTIQFPKFILLQQCDINKKNTTVFCCQRKQFYCLLHFNWFYCPVLCYTWALLVCTSLAAHACIFDALSFIEVLGMAPLYTSLSSGLRIFATADIGTESSSEQRAQSEESEQECESEFHLEALLLALLSLQMLHDNRNLPFIWSETG